MEIKNKLKEFDLDVDNCVVIGSGILNVLGIRESMDIDVVITEEKYKELKNTGHFQQKESHGREVLVDDLLEVMTHWDVLGKVWYFNDILECTVIIDEVRYNTIEFLLGVKKQWIGEGEARQKDIDDIKLMEDYLQSIK